MKKILLNGLACGLCLVAMVGIANAGPMTWAIADGGNGHSYEIIDSNLSWTDAKDAAETAGGYLATITSAEEQLFVSTLVGNHVIGATADNTGYIIGGFKVDEQWQWVTSEPWDYKYWRPNEPNYSYENYLYMDGRSPIQWGWNNYVDVNCWYGESGLFGYIVESAPVIERRFTSVPEPTTLLLLATGLAGIAAVNIRRHKK